LGFSDHLAQVIKINSGKGNRRNKIVLRRQLTNNNIEEFKNVLSKESWNEVFNQVCSNSIRIGIVVVVHWVGCVCNQS
jgi:hypothetical protein